MVSSRSSLSIRPATVDDTPFILSCIRGLAEHEGRPEVCVLTEDDLRCYVFGPRPYCEIVIAEDANGPVGLAVYFFYFSTFSGQPALFLEDLFVLRERRAAGVGKALMTHLARLALEQGCGRLDWTVVPDNASAIAFYEQLGAIQSNDHLSYWLMGSALSNLAMG